MDTAALDQELLRRTLTVIECRHAMERALIAARDMGMGPDAIVVRGALRDLRVAQNNWEAVGATLAAVTRSKVVRRTYYLPEGDDLTRLEVVYGPQSAIFRGETIATFGQRVTDTLYLE
jgi:hypothetical protein